MALGRVLGERRRGGGSAATSCRITPISRSRSWAPCPMVSHTTHSSTAPAMSARTTTRVRAGAGHCAHDRNLGVRRALLSIPLSVSASRPLLCSPLCSHEIYWWQAR
jgi:hypothetical protein